MRRLSLSLLVAAAAGFAAAGISPAAQQRSEQLWFGRVAPLDTIAIPGLERAARFYAYFVSEAAKAPRSAIDPAQ